MTTRFISFLVPLLFVVACSAANDADKESDGSGQDRTGWFEDTRVEQYLSIMEETLNTTMLFYSRVSPEVAKRLKPIEMPPEAIDVVRCLVEEVEDRNLEKQFDESLKLSAEFNQYIKDTPELTLFGLEQDAQSQKMQEKMLSPEFKPLTDVSTECGVIKMNMKATSSSGITEAMQFIPRER